MAPRIVEALEDRVLLSADVEAGPPPPPPILGFILLPSPPSADFDPIWDRGQAIDNGFTSLSSPAGTTEAEGTSDAETPTEALPDVIWGPSPESLTVVNGLRGLVSSASPGRSSPLLLVRDEEGNAISSADRLGVGFGSVTPLLMPIMPGASETGPMPEVGPPAPEDLAQIDKLDWSPNIIYSGTMEAQGVSAVRIPVGPNTRMLTLGLKSDEEGAEYVPRVEQVFLMGRRGEVLSALAGVSILGDDDGQTLFISIQGAPIGGEVVICLVPIAGPAHDLSAQTGAVGEDASGDGDGDVGGEEPKLPSWDGSGFELSVVRTESSSQTNTFRATTSTAIETVPTTAIGATGASSSIGPLTTTTESALTTSEAGVVARVAVSATEVRPGTDFESADEGPAEVYLGPLVSRTAAAFGPALATSADEPTTSTERGGRTTTDGLESFGADLDLDMILAIQGRGDAVEATDADPALTTLRGPGGVPIVVAGLRLGERGRDDDALAASAVGSAADAPILAEALEPAAPLDDERGVVRAGLGTRAVGFLIGIGLASGPLYPDLVAFARKKLRRKPRRPGARSPRGR